MNLFDLSRCSLAAEAEASSGTIDTETEYVYYAQLKDMGFLKRATSTEVHEQFEMKIDTDNDSKIRLRVRKTVDGSLDGIKYIQTIKLDKDSDGPHTCSQVAVDVTKGFFDTLLVASGGYGMRKRRYTIRAMAEEAPAGNWEVDVYIDSSGKMTTPWVKIDFEVPAGSTMSKPKLPAAFEQELDQNNCEDDKKIGLLYKEYFITDLLA